MRKEMSLQMIATEGTIILEDTMDSNGSFPTRRSNKFSKEYHNYK